MSETDDNVFIFVGEENAFYIRVYETGEYVSWMTKLGDSPMNSLDRFSLAYDATNYSDVLYHSTEYMNTDQRINEMLKLKYKPTNPDIELTHYFIKTVGNMVCTVAINDETGAYNCLVSRPSGEQVAWFNFSNEPSLIADPTWDMTEIMTVVLCDIYYHDQVSGENLCRKWDGDIGKGKTSIDGIANLFNAGYIELTPDGLAFCLTVKGKKKIKDMAAYGAQKENGNE
jgi:hypothetical protein